MKKYFLCFIVGSSVLLAVYLPALAAPSAFGGHYYELITFGQSQTWSYAKSDAESRSHLGMTGHLATITSADEQSFITTLLPAYSGTRARVWIGGYQPSGSTEPAGGWRWITGEPWSYTNWNSPFEPNNEGGNENNLAILIESDSGWGHWNDENGDTLTYNPLYSVVEYEGETSSVPTLNEWGMIILTATLGTGAVYYMKRKRSAVRI